LKFTVYIVLDFWHPSSITMVQDKLEQAPPTFQELWCELVLDDTAHACWEKRIYGTGMTHWPQMWHQSLRIGNTEYFSISRPVDKGQSKERSKSELQTNFFLLLSL
jgi:hypothetical protein